MQLDANLLSKLQSSIRERKVSPLVQICSENFKPVTEKNNEGQNETWDNFQIELESLGKNMLVGEITGYLHYYDVNGNNLGHDFDLVNKELKLGERAYLSLSLEPPANFAYVVLEIEAEKCRQSIVDLTYVAGMVVLIFAAQMLKDTFSPLISFVLVVVYLILLRIVAYYVENLRFKT